MIENIEMWLSKKLIYVKVLYLIDIYRRIYFEIVINR